MTIGRFQAGIAALLRYPPDNTYLLLKRSADKDFGAGGWECVTGRVNQGEGFTEALRREGYEELGLEQIRIEFIVGTTHFYRGERRPENELVGVVFCCAVDDPEAIRTSSEHSEYRWATVEEIETAFPDDPWIRETVDRAEAIRRLLPITLLDFHRESGFELG